MTGKYDLCVNQYATYTKVFTWLQESCCAPTVGASPDPVDLTGYTALMQIRPYPGGAVLYDATDDLTLGGVFGTISLLIPALDTQNFTWWQAVYDLVLVSPLGLVMRLLQGAVKVNTGVTIPNFGTVLTTDDGITITTDSGEPIAVSND